MVESRDQPRVFGQQHAVAEDIARHVADADAGEIFSLDVAAHFAEMALDRFPGAPRRDAHFLVVIAMAAAAGEGVAQPEIAVFGDLVGDVGESRGALVGGHHQIGIVAVQPQDLRRRHDAAIRFEIVGDVQQRIDERLVGGDADRLRLFAGGIGGHGLGIEAALGAHRHDHRILDLLRLHQPQYFGAEILAPVTPADAATGDGPETQMHAFHVGGIDEDFPPGPRRRQFIQLFAVQLDGDIGFGPPLRIRLIVIGAQHILDHIAEAADDAVVVQAGHIAKRGFDPLLQPRRVRRASAPRPVTSRAWNRSASWTAMSGLRDKACSI